MTCPLCNAYTKDIHQRFYSRAHRSGAGLASHLVFEHSDMFPTRTVPELGWRCACGTWFSRAGEFIDHITSVGATLEAHITEGMLSQL